MLRLLYAYALLFSDAPIEDPRLFGPELCALAEAYQIANAPERWFQGSLDCARVELADLRLRVKVDAPPVHEAYRLWPGPEEAVVELHEYWEAEVKRLTCIYWVQARYDHDGTLWAALCQAKRNMRIYYHLRDARLERWGAWTRRNDLLYLRDLLTECEWREGRLP